MERIRYSFVTVVYEGDVALLRLQARSMALYLDPAMVEEILIVANFNGPVPASWYGDLHAQLGALAGKLRVIAGETMAETRGVSGWISQQALKLIAAAHVRSPRYVVLDAKTHFVRPLSRDFLEAEEDGRARLNGYGYETHPLRPRLEATCAFLGLDPGEAIPWFPRTSPPFTMLTAATLSLLQGIRRLDDRPLAQVLQARGLSEFFLYSGWLAAAGVLRTLYSFDQPFTPQLWPADGADEAKVAAQVARTMDERLGPTFSLHRGAIAGLTPDGRLAIAGLWERRGLMSAEGAAEILAPSAQQAA